MSALFLCGKASGGGSLKCQQDAIAFGIGFLLDVDLTVDHRHDPVSELRSGLTPRRDCQNCYSLSHV